MHDDSHGNGSGQSGDWSFPLGRWAVGALGGLLRGTFSGLEDEDPPGSDTDDPSGPFRSDVFVEPSAHHHQQPSDAQTAPPVSEEQEEDGLASPGASKIDWRRRREAYRKHARALYGGYTYVMVGTVAIAAYIHYLCQLYEDQWTLTHHQANDGNQDDSGHDDKQSSVLSKYEHDGSALLYTSDALAGILGLYCLLATQNKKSVQLKLIIAWFCAGLIFCNEVFLRGQLSALHDVSDDNLGESSQDLAWAITAISLMMVVPYLILFAREVYVTGKKALADPDKVVEVDSQSAGLEDPPEPTARRAGKKKSTSAAITAPSTTMGVNAHESEDDQPSSALEELDEETIQCHFLGKDALRFILLPSMAALGATSCILLFVFMTPLMDPDAYAYENKDNDPEGLDHMTQRYLDAVNDVLLALTVLFAVALGMNFIAAVQKSLNEADEYPQSGGQRELGSQYNWMAVFTCAAYIFINQYFMVEQVHQMKDMSPEHVETEGEVVCIELISASLLAMILVGGFMIYGHMEALADEKQFESESRQASL